MKTASVNFGKPLKVSVGLSVYNEEKNIAGVIKGVLKQKPENWELAEILVYNDGSNDKTVAKAREVKNDLVRIHDDGQRQGKTRRLSQMFQNFGGDILVMFDGDIRISGTNVITKLVESFADPRVMLVGGNSTPFAPRTFFQRCVYSTFSVFYRSRKRIRGGNNIFGATGSILAIRKLLAQKIRLPEIVNEDAFIYLYCLKNKYKFAYQDDAVIYYTLPTSLKDYLRQAFRSHPEAVNIELEKYFGKLVGREFKRSKRFYLTSVVLTFLENPLEVVCMFCIHALCKPLYSVISTRYKLSWFTAASTH